ncbi:MAG: sigma 54-interacting transcriptional regulator, partial [Myxococcales bacterium]|nr:sigma 54-interacting transcriptional regulator [Myxococcales bacterium]
MTLETQRSGARAGSAEAARVPGLVIVGHPDPARIGDRAWLADLASPGSEARLSRTEPPFAAPKMNAFAPLDEPHLSRSPLMLHCNMDGLRLDASGTSTKVVVDGAPLAGELALSDAALERGVVIELAGRVTLVLTRLGPPAATAVDALGMVGLSDGIARVRRDIANVADTEVPVLVRGETGSGKELVARALHAESPRARGPFVAVNVAGLPETLAAAELFGHERGAFSGADRPRRGLFGEARGGTLFLDEIGDASPDVQVLLLRALETGEVRPVGADRAVPVDVRLVAATDRDLDLATADGAFRSPLYHRLAGYVIAVPPLRARRADVGLLLAAFLTAERAALGEAPLAAASTPWLASADLSRLVRYGWPGNVR